MSETSKPVEIGASKPVKRECKTSAVGETALQSQYFGNEVGETFHGSRVVQSWTEVEVNCGGKVSGGVNLWSSVSTKKFQSFGTEFDVVGFITMKASEKTTVRFEFGQFLVQGPDIIKTNATITRAFSFSDEKLSVGISNSTSYYLSRNEDVIQGGVINKTAVNFSREIFKGKASVSVTPAISIDNNPFALGEGPIVSMGFLNGGVNIPINSRLSFFVRGGISKPLFGDTFRTFKRQGGLGFTYVIK